MTKSIGENNEVRFFWDNTLIGYHSAICDKQFSTETQVQDTCFKCLNAWGIN